MAEDQSPYLEARMKKENPPPQHPSCERPQIDYPCIWVYKVIGEDQETLREIIHTACAPATVEITYSHSSSGGRYHSLSASLIVHTEEIRLSIYEILKSHPAIKIVL
jgi:uncharacterized protein